MQIPMAAMPIPIQNSNGTYYQPVYYVQQPIQGQQYPPQMTAIRQDYPSGAVFSMPLSPNGQRPHEQPSVQQPMPSHPMSQLPQPVPSQLPQPTQPVHLPHSTPSQLVTYQPFPQQHSPPHISKSDSTTSVSSSHLFSLPGSVSTANSATPSLSTTPDGSSANLKGMFSGMHPPLHHGPVTSLSNLNEYFMHNQQKNRGNLSGSLSSMGKVKSLGNLSGLSSLQRMTPLKQSPPQPKTVSQIPYSQPGNAYFTLPKQPSLTSLNLEFYSQQQPNKKSRPNSPVQRQVSQGQAHQQKFMILPNDTPLQTPHESPQLQPQLLPEANAQGAGTSALHLLTAASQNLQEEQVKREKEENTKMSRESSLEEESIATTGTQLPPIRQVFSFTSLSNHPPPLMTPSASSQKRTPQVVSPLSQTRSTMNFSNLMT